MKESGRGTIYVLSSHLPRGQPRKMSVRTGVRAGNCTGHLKHKSRGAVIGQYSHLYKIRTHGHKK